MDVDFWNDLWEREQIPFHREEVNPSLINFFGRLGLREGATVFVPLCGKSVDMTWMVEQGMSVFGVELNESAARAYFAERGLEVSVNRESRSMSFSAGGVTIAVGDLFAIDPEDFEACDAWYDRAALIALPDEMRAHYVEHVSRFCGPNASGLLVSMEHDRGTGPPFSVGAEEIARLYDRRRVEKVGERRGGRGGDGRRAVATTYLVSPDHETVQ